MSDLHILGLLAARGGSKGIPGKNIRPLCGRPLLAWAAAAIVHAPGVSRAICSTDDDAIAEAARASGLETPFRRPANLATDSASIVVVMYHALESVDRPERPFTHIVLVQATTPTVTVDDVEKAIDLIRVQHADTVISGFLVRMHHPALMYTIDPNGSVAWLLGHGDHARRRQEFPDVFVRTGLVYVVSTQILRDRKTIYGDRIYSLAVNEDRAITIDEESDFQRAEQLMKAMGRCNE